MIIIKTRNNIYHLKVPNLEVEEVQLYNKLTAQYCDKNCRALAVDLNYVHSQLSTTIPCDEIIQIYRT